MLFFILVANCWLRCEKIGSNKVEITPVKVKHFDGENFVSSSYQCAGIFQLGPREKADDRFFKFFITFGCKTAGVLLISLSNTIILTCMWVLKRNLNFKVVILVGIPPTLVERVSCVSAALVCKFWLKHVLFLLV